MTPEDRSREFEEALAKFEPKDERERDLVERLRKRFADSDERTERAIRQANVRAAEIRDGAAERRPLAADLARIEQETKEQLGAHFDLQAELIDRIVAPAKGG
jgi:hypothetical protein